MFGPKSFLLSHVSDDVTADGKNTVNLDMYRNIVAVQANASKVTRRCKKHCLSNNIDLKL